MSQRQCKRMRRFMKRLEKEDAGRWGAEALRKDGTDTDVPTKDAHIGSPCQACGYGGRHLDAPPCTSCPAHPKSPANIDREGWVSVEERLPEDEKDGETVLVIVFGKPHENITLHGAIMTAGYFRDEGWVLNEYPEWEGPEVTHWMPLPSPPAELEKRLNG